MGIFSYIRGADLTDAEVEAGAADGTLTLWRTSPDGERWFKKSRLPVIHGLPATDDNAILAEPDGCEDGDEDEDGEMNLVDETGEILASAPIVPIHFAGGEVAFDFGG